MDMKLWNSDCIEVVEVRPFERGNLRAHVTVSVHGLQVIGFRVIQEPGKAAWVDLPKVKDEKTGNWYPMAKTDDLELKSFLKAKVIQAWRAGHEETGQQLELLQGGISASEVRGTAGTWRSRTKARHAARQVFGDTCLQDDDISDVGVERGNAPQH